MGGVVGSGGDKMETTVLEQQLKKKKLKKGMKEGRKEGKKRQSPR